MKNNVKALVTALITVSLNASADLRPAHIFQDHMVLQREKPVPVWGWTDPGETVTVSFAGQTKTAEADEKGYWKAELDPMPASAKGETLDISGKGGSVGIKDVLVGEVWLCAGQSNMARGLKNDTFDYPFFKDYANDADYPSIRFINYTTDAADTPRDDYDLIVQRDTHWQVLNSSTAMDCMSIPFFFAKRIYQETGVPVGMVEVAVSGTPQTAWMAEEAIDAVAEKYKTSSDYKTFFAAADAKLATGKESFKSWADFLKTEAEWKKNPTGRWPGYATSDHPSVLYNALVHPAAPMALRGVLWHQGEGGPFANHAERMVAQIGQWRELFGQDFWFIWGSLGRNAGTPPPTVPLATSLRSNMNEEFLLASQNFGPNGKALLVNFTDLGNAGTHWGMKQEAGLRMAGAALAHIYEKPKTVYTGPEMTTAEIDGSEIRVHFKNTGGGLVYEPSIDGISGFLIAGNGKAVWADVKIDGDSVILSSPEISNPTAVYYGWHVNPHETLFNKEGYPAYNFRTTPRASGLSGMPKETHPLAELVSGPNKATLNVVHVRRNGYVFKPIIFRGSGTATVRAYLPKEWDDAQITIGDKPVKAAKQTAADGARFYEFPAEVNGPDILVLNTANPPDFSNVYRF